MKIAITLITVILLAGGYLWKTSPMNPNNKSSSESGLAGGFSKEIESKNSVQSKPTLKSGPRSSLSPEEIKSFPKNFQDSSYKFIGQDRHFNKFTNLMRGYIAFEDFEYKNKIEKPEDYLDFSASYIAGKNKKFSELDLKNLQDWQSTQLFLFMDYRETFRSVGSCKNAFFFQKKSLEIIKAASLIRDLTIARTATYVWQKETKRPAKINLSELHTMIQKLTNCRSSIEDQIMGQNAYNTFLETIISLQQTGHLEKIEEKRILEQLSSVNDIKAQIHNTLVHEYYGIYHLLNWIEFSLEQESKSLDSDLKKFLDQKLPKVNAVISEIMAQNIRVLNKHATLQLAVNQIEMAQNIFSEPELSDEPKKQKNATTIELRNLGKLAEILKWYDFQNDPKSIDTQMQVAKLKSLGIAENFVGIIALKPLTAPLSKITDFFNDLQIVSAKQFAVHLNAYQRLKGEYPAKIQDLYSELPIDFQHMNPLNNSEFDFSVSKKVITFRNYSGKKESVKF